MFLKYLLSIKGYPIFINKKDKTKKGKIEGNNFSLKIKRALIDELIITLGKQNIPR